jgi:hypothetical protein
MKRALMRWHRRLGLLLAVPLLLLAGSGILINHSTTLGWNHAPVYSDWLAQRYGVPREAPESGFHLDPQWLYLLGNQVHVGGKVLSACNGELRSVARTEQLLMLWCDQSLVLLNSDGSMIETLPAPMEDAVLASADEQIWMLRMDGALLLDEYAGEWLSAELPAGPLILPREPLPATLRQKLAAQQPLPGISRERVLLDLHSGRLFGPFGVLLVDLIGVLLVLMVLSAVWSNMQRLRHRRRRPL